VAASALGLRFRRRRSPIITAQLLASGRATHPWRGMSTTEISPAAAAYLRSVPGLFVQAVATSGPAAAAGLHPGDVITSLDGRAATQVRWHASWSPARPASRSPLNTSRQGIRGAGRSPSRNSRNPYREELDASRSGRRTECGAPVADRTTPVGRRDGVCFTLREESGIRLAVVAHHNGTMAQVNHLDNVRVT
jgi:hypothetical protein